MFHRLIVDNHIFFFTVCLITIVVRDILQFITFETILTVYAIGTKSHITGVGNTLGIENIVTICDHLGMIDIGTMTRDRIAIKNICTVLIDDSRMKDILCI